MTLRRFLTDVKIGCFNYQCVAFAGPDYDPMSEYAKSRYWEFENNYDTGANIEWINEPEYDLMDYEVQEIDIDVIHNQTMLIILLERK